MKQQRKDAGSRKSEQHPNHPEPKPSSVQSVVGSALQESDTTATNKRARTDLQPSQKSLSVRNQPSSSTHTNVVYLGLLKGLFKLEGLELNFELIQNWEIPQTGRQRIPDRQSDEADRTLTNRFQIASRNFQKLLA